MNMHLKAVKFTSRSQDPLRLDNISLRGNTVRYVILPDTLNLESLLIEEMPKKARSKDGFIFLILFLCLIFVLFLCYSGFIFDFLNYFHLKI